MLTELFYRKSESLLIYNAVKSHLKEKTYFRNGNSTKIYLNAFLKHRNNFLPHSWPKNPFIADVITNRRHSHKIITFKSPYTPLPPFDKDYLKEDVLHHVNVHFYPENDSDVPQKALIYLHGWGKNSFVAEEQWHFRIFKNTYKADIFAMELPYHHNRNPGGFSGQGFLDADPVRTLEAFRQATIETIFLYQILKNAYQDVGVAGISLGGHIATMTDLVLEDDFFNLIALAGTPIVRNLKKLRISPNLMYTIKNKEVQKIFSVLDFKTFPNKREKTRTYLFGGKFDSIISPQTVVELGKHLKCPTYLVPTGHFTFALYLPIITKKIAKW